MNSNDSDKCLIFDRTSCRSQGLFFNDRKNCTNADLITIIHMACSMKGQMIVMRYEEPSKMY